MRRNPVNPGKAKRGFKTAVAKTKKSNVLMMVGRGGRRM